MPYSLRRTRDDAGDSGQMSQIVIPTFDKDTGSIVDREIKENAQPEVGGAMVVGSPYGGTFSVQDWWQTTIITEILEERYDPADPNYMYVRFKTGNSEYEWKRF